MQLPFAPPTHIHAELASHNVHSAPAVQRHIPLEADSAHVDRCILNYLLGAALGRGMEGWHADMDGAAAL